MRSYISYLRVNAYYQQYLYQYPEIVGKAIQPLGFSQQRGSPSQKPSGCITFPQRVGQGIRPPGFSFQCGQLLEKPGGCITFSPIFLKGIHSPGFLEYIATYLHTNVATYLDIITASLSTGWLSHLFTLVLKGYTFTGFPPAHPPTA